MSVWNGGGGGDRGDTKVDNAVTGGLSVELGEFLLCFGKAHLEPFHIAEPSFAFGFGDAGEEVVADLDETVTLGGVGPEHRAADAGVLVDAGSAESAAACADGDLASLEVAEEFLPFVVGRDAVFLAGAGGPAAGQESHVRLDRLLGIDGFVAESHIDVLVPGDHLGDVRRQPVEDGIGDEQPSEVV
ncbi:hypothetical protein [Streptomyces sp. NPDC047070]|uniref:hypothetical protein n=1 Tax=Streptomyces sp. NPDC047070 TaxID=3154923 RepID=UPI003455A6A0